MEGRLELAVSAALAAVLRMEEARAAWEVA
jgi:hypothetical protein